MFRRRSRRSSGFKRRGNFKRRRRVRRVMPERGGVRVGFRM